MEWWKSCMKSWVEDPGIEEFEGLDMRKLDMDQAYVVAQTSLDNIRLYATSDDCHRCPYELLHTMSRRAPEPWVVSTAHAVSWRLIKGATEKYISTENRNGLVCEMRPQLGEFGVYHLNLTSDDCQLTTASKPVDIHMPFALAVILLAGLLITYATVSMLSTWTRRNQTHYGDRKEKMELRFRALDTFRGLVIVLMIFVNCGGGHYQRWMSHATWNGLNVADLVFPCFVWIMGFCIPLSTRCFISKGVPTWKAFLYIMKRSLLLFFIGVCLHTVFGDNYIGSMRVMGVLQRLAIAYFIVASFYLFTASCRAANEAWAAVWCWPLGAAFLALHTYITFRIHDPECPLGYLGPGGRHDNWVAAAKCAGGAAGYVDRLLLGESHIYPELSITIVYGANSIDPENILGSLTTVVHVVLGVQAGATLLQQQGHRARLVRWLAWATLHALLGGALAGFSKEDGLIPINKNLWSISFVLVLSSLSGLLLSVIYLLTDVLRVWSGGPLVAPGRNAVFLYVAHTLGDFAFPFRWRVLRMRTHALFLAENLWATALWLLVAHVMARKKCFFTL